MGASVCPPFCVGQSSELFALTLSSAHQLVRHLILVFVIVLVADVMPGVRQAAALAGLGLVLGRRRAGVLELRAAFRAAGSPAHMQAARQTSRQAKTAPVGKTLKGGLLEQLCLQALGACMPAAHQPVPAPEAYKGLSGGAHEKTLQLHVRRETHLDTRVLRALAAGAAPSLQSARAVLLPVCNKRIALLRTSRLSDGFGHCA